MQDSYVFELAKVTFVVVCFVKLRTKECSSLSTIPPWPGGSDRWRLLHPAVGEAGDEARAPSRAPLLCAHHTPTVASSPLGTPATSRTMPELACMTGFYNTYVLDLRRGLLSVSKEEEMIVV